MRPQNRKIHNKGQPLQQTKNYNCIYLSNQHIRFGTIALPVAISRKVSLKLKLCASATLIQKTSKNEPKHGPKNGTARRSHFWDRTHSLVKEQKKSTFTVPFLGPSGGTRNETAKSQNPQQRPTLATNKKLQLHLFKQPAFRFGTIALPVAPFATPRCCYSVLCLNSSAHDIETMAE